MTVKTEGLPKAMLRDSVELFNFAIKTEEEKGTEVVAGVDRESQVVYLFCRGRHQKAYDMVIKGEVKKVEPFEGLVEVSPSAFGDLYLTVMGLKERTTDLGNHPHLKVRASYRKDIHSIKLTFSDYKNLRRTAIAFFSPRNSFIQGVFEIIKNRLSIVRFTHKEEDLVVNTEYDREKNILTISHNYGDVELRDRYIPFLRFLLERTVIHGVPLDRPFSVRGFTLFPDGTMRVAGWWIGREKKVIILGGQEVEIPAYSLKLWRVLV